MHFHFTFLLIIKFLIVGFIVSKTSHNIVQPTSTKVISVFPFSPHMGQTCRCPHLSCIYSLINIISIIIINIIINSINTTPFSPHFLHPLTTKKERKKERKKKFFENHNNATSIFHSISINWIWETKEKSRKCRKWESKGRENRKWDGEAIYWFWDSHIHVTMYEASKPNSNYNLNSNMEVVNLPITKSTII